MRIAGTAALDTEPKMRRVPYPAVALSHADRCPGLTPNHEYDPLVPSFIIGPAVTGDVDAVLAFWRASAEDTNRSDSREGVQALIVRDPAVLILVEDASGIAGKLGPGLGLGR